MPENDSNSMPENDSNSMSVSDIRNRIESSLNPQPISHTNGTGTVARTRNIFERNRNANANSSSRYRKPPPLPPRPSDLDSRGRGSRPPIPLHGNILTPNGNRLSEPPLSAPPVISSDSSFMNGDSGLNSNGLMPPFSPISTSSVESESIRNSVMSHDTLPPTPHEGRTDYSSSEESGEDSSVDEQVVNERNSNDERESSLFLSKSNTLHTAVINQMKKDGLFTKLLEKKPLPPLPDKSETNTEESPSTPDSEVILRPAVPPHREPPSASRDKYSEVDPARRSVLINLEKLVVEIGQKEEYFIKILSLMVRKYPEYLKECDRESKKNNYEKWDSIVNDMVINLNPILEAHEILFEDIRGICLNWDSRKPNLAQGMLKKIDLLKICVQFLTKKNELSSRYRQLLDSSSEFAYATQQFERDVLNCPSIHDSEFKDLSYTPTPMSINCSNSEFGVTFMQQLDIVHQNVVRYTLFMDRYKKSISPDTDEAKDTDRVLKKLSGIVKDVNEQIGEKESVLNLLQLQQCLDKKFNVLTPGRKFLKEGPVLRQTRKERSERKLLLFTDVLLLCHPDFSTLHKIDLHSMEIKIPDSMEEECCFIVYSPQKSTVIYCDRKEIRDSWVNYIREAQKNIFEIINRKKPTTELSSSEPENIREHFSALWIPDDDVTMCMMQECAKHFNIANRRHHCRQCGYIICNKCSGKAPIRTCNFKSDRVCAACYNEIENKYVLGHLFPKAMMFWSTQIDPSPPYRVNSTEPMILLRNGKSVSIKEMFAPPKNGFKTRVPNLNENSDVWISGSMNYQGSERYGRLFSNMKLFIYAARCDPKEMQSIDIAGYSYSISNGKEKKTFKLTHHTGQKTNVIEFSVPDKAAEAWEKNLKKLSQKQHPNSN